MRRRVCAAAVWNIEREVGVVVVDDAFELGN